MKNLSIELENKPGALALMGELLGQAGVSLEGGGVFVHNNVGYAHFLMENAEKGKAVLEERGVKVTAIHEVLIQKLNQDMPGQLGMICRAMQEAGVNILVQYSNHDNQLVLVVDDYKKGKAVSDNWEKKRMANGRN